MSGGEPGMCLFDMWQHECEQQLTGYPGTFFVRSQINFVVEYLPQRYHMNVGSKKREEFLQRGDLLDDAKVHNNMTRMMKFLPVTEVDLVRIINMVATKAKLMDSDPRNSDRDVIPVIMSLRIFYTQQYSEDLDRAWASRLGRSLQNCMPALDSAVVDLDNVVYDTGSCLRDQCPICLMGFEDGDKITRLPCLHDFHASCIQEWLKRSHLCPFCRFPLPVCRDIEAFCPFKENRPACRKPRRSNYADVIRTFLPGIRVNRRSFARPRIHVYAVRTFPEMTGARVALTRMHANAD